MNNIDFLLSLIPSISVCPYRRIPSTMTSSNIEELLGMLCCVTISKGKLKIQHKKD